MSIETIRSGAVQYRSATIEDVDVEKSELYVRAAPYDLPTDIGGGITETFVRGTFSRAVKAPDRLLVWRGHNGPVVGRGSEVEDRTDGVWIRSRLSRTQAAKDMIMDIVDRIAADISIEFIPKPQHFDVSAAPDGRISVVHRRAHLLGHAIVPVGAYGDGGSFIASLREDDEKERLREEARLWLAKFKAAQAQ